MNLREAGVMVLRVGMIRQFASLQTAERSRSPRQHRAERLRRRGDSRNSEHSKYKERPAAKPLGSVLRGFRQDKLAVNYHFKVSQDGN
jgi:hypothetical protein